MKKRFAAVFAATAVLGVTTAFAANPFSDVTPNDWAYQAVSQLAAEGVINGYPDGTFKGERNITRYEMAQMVAKAIARQGRVDAEQNAMINRLANEFSSELNNLGVRVGNLENKVGNFKFTGDARLRYQGGEKGSYKNDVAPERRSKFDYRARVQFAADVNDNTKAVIRLKTASQFGKTQPANTEVDRAYVTHNFGKNVSVTAGRFGEFLGQGLVYDDTFDGAKLTVGNDKYQASVAHGYLTWSDNPVTAEASNPTFTAVDASAKLGNNITVGGVYVKGNKLAEYINEYDGKEFKDIYGANLSVDLGGKWNAAGEWVKSNLKKSNAWVAGLSYGDYDITKQGTWTLMGQYFHEDINSPVVSSTWDQAYNYNYKGVVATANYAVAKNVGLTAVYGFDSKFVDKNENQDETRGDFWKAELNYKF